MKQILIDCDDVLLHWLAGFRTWLRTERRIETCAGGPHDWDMSAWLKVTSKESQFLVAAFNSSPEFGNLRPYKQALDTLRKFSSRGFAVDVITSCGEDSLTVSRRVRNIVECFPNCFGEIHCLPLGVSKRALLSSYPNSYWIEDNYQNALIGLECGHKPFMLTRTNNLKFKQNTHPDIIWCEDLNRVFREIINHSYGAQSQ